MSAILSNLSKLPIAFGGASISGEGAGYGFGDISFDDAVSLLKHAKERGIKIFDSAPIYGFGESERRMGKAFQHCREDVFLISKSGVTWHDNMRVDMSNDPKITKKMLEQSLRDFNCDYIDLFMIHWPDKNVDIRKTMEILAKAKLDGRIKHIGLCNTYKEDFQKASEVDKIEVVQSQLNFFEREVTKDILPLVIENEISFMSWGTLDKGILTGRVFEKRMYDKSDCRSWAPWWKAMNKVPRYEAVKKITPFLKERGHTPLEFALSFNLSHAGVDSLLCGARTHEQLDSLISALDHRVDNSLLETAEQFSL